MLLVVDVGNTQTHLGTFASEQLVQHWRFATVRESTADELGAAGAATATSALVAVAAGCDARVPATFAAGGSPQAARSVVRHPAVTAASRRVRVSRCAVAGMTTPGREVPRRGPPAAGAHAGAARGRLDGNAPGGCR